jgi:hypothetical protein
MEIWKSYNRNQSTVEHPSVASKAGDPRPMAITGCHGPAMAAVPIAQEVAVPMLQRLSLLGAESLPDLLGEAWEADPRTA